MDPLYQLSQKFFHARNQSYRRYFIRNNILREQMSILVGQRGIGKTTLLIQYLLDYAQGDLFSPKILYVPSDHFSIGNLALYTIAEQFVQHGGEFIAFDEIHKTANWSISLKSIYDSFPKLKVLASGSSALEIHKGSHDLSRRALVYQIFNLCHILARDRENKGSLRETFLFNILSRSHDVTFPLNRDFLIDQSTLIQGGGS